tara:strand:- start:2333 stop:3187 length:855 start_codon:yes stop_codon:yes gene_type:complete
MSLRKILGSVLLIAIVFSVSCVTSTKQKKEFEWPRNSFVKYEGWIYKQTCTPKDPENLASDCYGKQQGVTGSGSVIAKSFDGAYVLTAAHMCDRRKDIKLLESIEKKNVDESGERKEKVKFFIKQYVVDLDDFKYNTKIVAYDSDIDACITFTWGLFKDSIPISQDAPKIGSKVYNIAAPAGFFGKDMVPLFEGRYVGVYNKYSTIFTLPAIGGSSGSPILNEDGELIGLVFARHVRFHHIVLSSRFNRLKRFIITSVEEHTRKRNQIHNLDPERSVIIKFNDK